MFKTRFISMLVLLMTAVTGAWAQSALTGFFTINAEGDQVQFSSGNLQATYDGTSWSWAFATNQWDYIGNAVANNKINGNGTVSENGTVDLFGWVGASSNYTGAAQYGIAKAGTTNTYGNVADESLKSDWGNTIGTGWRTLTGDEWTYLFNTRTTGGTVGTTAQARYTHATINTNGTGVNGMILFPDGVDIAASEFSTLGTVNGNSAWGTKCTATQWTALADKGCVFLPAAGNRLGATMYFVGNRGFYWSSSPKTSHLGYTYNVHFFSGSLNPQDENNRDGGLSVRLVKPYERPTYTVSLNDGEENPTTWTAKAGSATTFTALPQDVAEGKTVTLKYSGTKRVKNVKAVKEAPATDLSMVDCAGTARTDGQWTANCYMVHTAGDYKLPLVYGNAIKAGQTNSAAYTGVENANTTLTFPRHDGNAITAPWIKDNGITVTQAELLWQDAQGLVTAVGIDGDYLTLTVGKDATTQEGNALVAAKDAQGTIVWSWHIWVTKQTFAAADLTTVATGSHNYTVTPVNLGWVSTSADGKQGYSTFYQWGRKDAFKGTGAPADANVYDISGATVTGLTYTSSTTATIADNIKNPTTFYNVGGMPSTAEYFNLWDAQQTGADNITTATKKTVYDPSPAGFCVPTGNLYYYFGNGEAREVNTWDDTNKGATWNLGITGNALFFPASGWRDKNGSLSNVGSGGVYWSASAYGSSTYYARYLYLFSSFWYWGCEDRSSGYSVRAVAEE